MLEPPLSLSRFIFNRNQHQLWETLFNHLNQIEESLIKYSEQIPSLFLNLSHCLVQLNGNYKAGILKLIYNGGVISTSLGCAVCKESLMYASIRNSHQIEKCLTCGAETKASYDSALKIPLERAHIKTSTNNFKLSYIDVCDMDIINLSNLLESNANIIELKINTSWVHEEAFMKLIQALHKNTTVLCLDIPYPGEMLTERSEKALGECLKINHTLQKLAIKGGGSAIGLQAIGEGLKENISLRKLKLKSYLSRTNRNVKPSDVLILSQALILNQNLQKLDLSFLSLSRSSSEVITILVEGLKNNISLISLNLGYNNIEDEGAKAIAKVISSHPQLKIINLTGNEITSKAIQYFACKISSNTVLENLILCSNKIDDKGLKKLAKSLENKPAYTSFYLENNKIGNEGVKRLSKLIKRKSNIKEINLANNQVTSKGIKFLAKSIKKQSNLSKLNLSKNLFGPTGVKYLIQSFQYKSTLQVLKLSNISLEDEGLIILAGIMETLPVIEILELRENNINDQGAITLASNLQSSINLKLIDLNYNKISDIGAKAFVKVMKENPTLKSIRLFQNNLSFYIPSQYKTLHDYVNNLN